MVVTETTPHARLMFYEQGMSLLGEKLDPGWGQADPIL